MNVKEVTISLYSGLSKYFPENTTSTKTNSITISTTVNIKIDTVYIQNKRLAKKTKQNKKKTQIF